MALAAGGYAAIATPTMAHADTVDISHDPEDAIQPHAREERQMSDRGGVPRRTSATAAFFGLRDDSSSVSGDSVDDEDLEAAASQVDVSMRFLCVSRDAVKKYLPIVVSISLGAYFGAGMRMLLAEFADRLSWEQGALVRLLGGGFFLPNALGCFIMGLTVRCKPLLRDRFSLYVTGVTTGFCGCCTTFSRWDVEIAAKLVHGLWLTALLLIGVQIGCAWGSFRAGVHTAEAIIAYLCARKAAFPKPPIDAKQIQSEAERQIAAFEAIRVHGFDEGVARRMNTTKDALVSVRDASRDLLLDVTRDEQNQLQPAIRMKTWAWVGSILFLWLLIPPFVGFGNYPSSRLFGLTLAPFGAMLRYYLSLFNSQSRWKDFPLYTFIANVAASTLSCIILVIGSATSNHSSAAYRAYVFLGDGGLVVGFCGSLSTVSTWINELDSLSSRSTVLAYRYAAISIITSQVASIFILGMYAATASAPLLV